MLRSLLMLCTLLVVFVSHPVDAQGESVFDPGFCPLVDPGCPVNATATALTGQYKALAPLAVDCDPTTVWNSQTWKGNLTVGYEDAVFANSMTLRVGGSGPAPITWAKLWVSFSWDAVKWWSMPALRIDYPTTITPGTGDLYVFSLPSPVGFRFLDLDMQTSGVSVAIFDITFDLNLA